MKHHDVEVPISPELIAHLRPLIALSILLLPVLTSLPPLPRLLRPVQALFTDSLPLDSFLPIELPSRDEEKRIESYGLRLWRQIVLVGGGLIGFTGWTIVFGRSIIAATQGDETVKDVLAAAGMMLAWMYLFTYPLFRPPSTPPWSSTIVYAILCLTSLGALSLATFLRASNGRFPPWAGSFWISFEIVNVLPTTLALYAIGGLPLATPETLVRVQVAPDDTVTPFTWLSFSWVDSFIRFGNEKELQPEDLPEMSLTQQCAHVFRNFNEIKSNTLLWKIFWANRLDLILDATLTLASVVFNYAGPFFLKRILDGLTDRSPRAMSQAYIYTFLALIATTSKAITDLLHLWHGRRATVRIKAELIAAVYAKALRRKDASGVITKAEPESETKDGKKGDAKVEKKTNADSGKVVNLMAGDTNRIANTIAAAYYIYSAPFELAVASVFLYNILGWSAFAGIVILIVAVPLNSYVSKRSIRITQDLLKARDGRISVMNELIGAITFIKFFAWSAQWKERANKARASEMKQMIRMLINSIYFSMLWALAPLFVTLISFFCFILIAKQDLTVSVAFTAISLFSMLRMPLNVIPTFVVMILQAHVSVKRIEDFLAEDEVPDWVSSLKRSSEPPLVKTKISFENASFCWNTGKQSETSATPVPATTVPPTAALPAAPSSPTTSTGTSTAIDSSTVLPEDSTPARFTLSDLSVTFPLGKLTVITGPTGSGKTAILTALLGEMELLNGSTHLPKYTQQVDKRGLRNSIAYASQTAWLQQKSIRENILFGEEMDEKRYEDVLEACALVPDLNMLEDGDQTEIGAKGVSLSGGQKARVALARAVYSYTQHLLLDDPLAAVDSHTAKHLTDHCLNGPILQGRTILLVSHHVELLLPSAHYLIRMLDGRIDAQGTPADLKSRGELDGLIATEEAEIEKSEPISADQAIDEETKTLDAELDGKAEEKKERKKSPGKKLIQDEERAVGNVKWETYKLYIVAATYTTWFWSLTVLVLGQVFAIGERYWLKIWGNGYLIHDTPGLLTFFQPALSGYHNDFHTGHVHQHILHAFNATTLATNGSSTSWPFHDLPPAHTHPLFYLWIYSGIVIGTALLGILSNGLGSWGQYRAAVNLHNRLLDTVMSGTIRFFNVTPVGRILNRFSKDIETIDGSLNSGLRTVIVYVASLIGALATVAVIVPWFLIPAAIISWLYLQYSILYLRVGRSLRRLEAISRSPIYSGFAELLDGVISVRAFSAEARFMNQLCDQVDKMHSAFYYYWMMNRWLLLRFDILGGVSVGLTTLFALTGAVDPGSAGMAILSAQSFVSACYWVSRFWGQLEMDFNSVERVQEYLSIPQEPPAIIPSSRPPAYWPSSTPINPDSFLSVRNLEIKYAPDLPTVFSGSFEVRAGEKIGLIGRTGSGKSTLAMSLLRFCEPSGGSIWLDGVDITSIGVDDLRSRITYIPQDAVLFSGTVRMNLDPFDEHTDEELNDALTRVNLGSDIPDPSRLPSRVPSSNRLGTLAAETAPSLAPSSQASARKPNINLKTEVSSGGANFSQGQRQLVAMARALLRRSNLIIMDEATASVDFATDNDLQTAIRSEFTGSTLITIAHRLSSVIDYDRLLVLADGKVAEFDTPINLLKEDGSLFKNLCEKSGKYRELYRAAEKKEKGELLVDV